MEHLKASMLTPNTHILHAHVPNWEIPQTAAFLQGKAPSWLPSQDEGGSLPSLNADKQHYVPEK